MTVAKVLELSSQSEKSFHDAIQRGIEKAHETLAGIKTAWIEDQIAEVDDGKIVGYRVHMKVTFVLKE